MVKSIKHLALGLSLSLSLVFFASTTTARTVTHGDDGSGKVVIDLPTGWLLAHSDTAAGQKINEYLPSDKTLRDWDEMITVYEMDLGPQVKDAAPGVAGMMLQLFAAKCQSLIQDISKNADDDNHVSMTLGIGCELKADAKANPNAYLRAVETLSLATFNVRGSSVVHMVQYATHSGTLGQPAADEDREAGRAGLLQGETFLGESVTFCIPGNRSRECR